ncbi:MAG TPA: endo alpha-1,4 polygalactosaminidase, partial [Baekduia sp.]|nr:endo alpha-1,4 polygalactosaminidase [Baekduia sp.]
MTRCRRDAASPGVHRCLLGLIAAALALVPAVVPAPSSASSSAPRQKLEAERLHVSRAAGHVVRDASASGRRALLLTGRGTARIRVSVTRESRLDVVARAARCSGGPRLVVAIDGARVISSAVKGRRWSTAKAGATIAAGAHRVTLRLANPHRSSHCRRSVRIDRLDFVGAATAPAAPGAPAAPAVKAPPVTAAPVATGTPAAPGTRWIPAPGITWQWQLSGTVDQSVDAQMYDIDLFDTAPSLVASLHASG